MKEFTYKAVGIRKKQRIIAICEIAAMMKIAEKGQKMVSRSIQEIKHPVFA